MLLTNLALKRTRKSLWFIVGSYLTRWRVEDAIRFIKQSHRLVDIRVRGYRSLKNLVAPVLCAACFAAVCLGEGLNLRALTHKVIRAAKRIFGSPDFHCCAIADGIAAAPPKAPCASLRAQLQQITGNGSSIPSERKWGNSTPRCSLSGHQFMI